MAARMQEADEPDHDPEIAATAGSAGSFVCSPVPPFNPPIPLSLLSPPTAAAAPSPPVPPTHGAHCSCSFLIPGDVNAGSIHHGNSNMESNCSSASSSCPIHNHRLLSSTKDGGPLSSDSSRNNTKAESASLLSFALSSSTSLSSPDSPNPSSATVPLPPTHNSNSSSSRKPLPRARPASQLSVSFLPHSKPDPSSFSTLSSRASSQSTKSELQQQQQQLQLQLQRRLHLAMRQSKNARSILSNSLQGQSTTNNPSGLQFETTFESPDQHSDSIASQPLQSTTSSSSQDPAPPQPGDNAPQNVLQVHPTHQPSSHTMVDRTGFALSRALPLSSCRIRQFSAPAPMSFDLASLPENPPSSSQSVDSLDPSRLYSVPPSTEAPAHHSPQNSASPHSPPKSTILPMVSQVPDLSFPSVLELSLTLSADIEIHRLWKTITETLSQKFHATKITLCLPQDPTVVSTSIENNLHQTRPWGLKAHWDYKQHFLDENTITPKDEFAHHHHRLQKSAAHSQDEPGRQSLRPPTSTPLTSSSSSFSSSSSSSFSRRRAAHPSSSFSINLGNQYHHHGYTDNDNGGGIDITDESRNYVPIPDTKSEYHEDYWSTNPPLDGGYSSSTSTASSYSSVSSSSAMQASRAANPRGFGMHSSTECFANLQSLEYDPEPLLTEHTIDRILRAGKTVVLTREYVGSKGERRDSGRMRSYLSSEDDDDYLTYRDAGPADDYTDLGEVEINGAESERLARAIRTGAGFSFEQDAGSDMDSTSSRYSSEGSYFPPVESALSASYENSTKYVAAHSKAGYADFVQGLHPTWSQSPAPSPNIIKEDPNINPFFFQPLTSYPTMDDDAFDPPDPTPESTEDGHSSSSEHGTPEHIDGSRNYSASLPQTHGPASTNTSKASIPTQPASILANARSLIHMPLYRSMDRNSQRYLPSDIQHQRPPAMPVGIISFLSDQVPYPPEALDILTELNPFIANQVTNALRLEDVVARSSRWGDMSSSSMSDGVRTKETFTESIQRKMKENYDPGTSRAMSSNPTVPHAGLKQPSDRHFFKYAYEEAAERTNSPAAIPHQQSQSTRPPKGAPVPDSDHDDQYAEASTMDHHDSDVFGTTGDSIDSLASEAQSNNNDKPSLEKQPEIYFNLDTTEDEIHRSLNLLNLDITGSATCPLAPQTKRMLGKQHHHSSKHAQSHQIENAFLSTWNGNRRRTESSPQALDTEDQDTDGMWQTLSTDEFDQRPHSLPNTRIVDNDFDLVGHESPYHGPLRTLSPSITPRRHHFSASKRSGFGKRRKSMREQMKHQPHHPHTSGSPVPSSPYISTIPGFCSQQCETSSSCPGFCSGVFSPDPSPMASPTVHQSGIFGHAFGMVDPRKAPDAGSYSKLQSGNQGRDRNERTPLSRHGSGWSITSDDTSLASQSTQNDKHAAGRKQKKRHNTISSERPAHNPFPRTRLLRLIVDAIPHHVFTLSPQSGCMTWLNQRSLQYTGVPLVQLLHTPWTRLLHEDDRETFQPLFKDCFERGEMFNAQYRVRRFDGQYRWFLGRVLPVRDCGNNIVHWFGTSTDIHDQKLAELQLNRQIELELNEKKYRLLAEAIPQIVFTATPQGGLTYANAKWFTYSGQVFEQACGLGFMDHVHPEDRAKCFLPTNISSGMRSPPAASESESDARYSTSPGTAYGQGPGDVSYQTEMRLLRKDGKYRWFLVKCISVEVVEQGRKWFGTCTDINDQKLLEHKLKEAHDAAQKSTESKTRFLSNMSHEIRTPLVGISGMVGFLITTDLTSEQLEYVHTVQQSAEALLLVINDILDLSKVEAGMMKLEMEPFSIHAMIEGANELLSTLAIQKGLELGFLVEDDVPEIVVGDRIRLRQVLINIIGNAIKFTTHGEVFSRCSLVPPTKPNANSDELTIRFEISDTGKGFDESERAVMFKPFSQVDTSSTRKHGGTGLGLVLSKEFVELHGGQIQCESVKGQGSKFSFTFVAHVPPPNAAAARVTTPISTSEAHMDGLLGDNLSSVRTPAVSPSGFKLAGPKELKSQTEPSLLKHITGLKLIPGEMCFAEPDPEDTRKTASEAFKMVNQKIERGEFVALGTTLRRNATDLDDGATEAKAAPSSGPSLSSTGPGSGVEERRYPRSGQITPSQPPMGEPASVAIVAANIPNPAVDMKLTIPVKMLESKRAAAAAAAAAIAATAAESTSSSQPSRPDLPSSSNSSNSSSSASTSSSNDSKISASTDESSSTSTSSVSPPTLGVNVDAQEQPRILIIADFPHARETIVHLINQLIPKDLNPLLDVAKGMEEGIEFLMGERQHVAQTSKYNYLVINMAEYMAVMEVFSVVQRDGVNLDPNVMTCMITTPVQRVALMEAVKYEVASMELAKPCSDQPPVKVIPERIEWVFKPLTKSKLYVAFADVAGRHDSPSDATGSGASVLAGFDDSSKVDMKRKSAQQVALSQQKVFTQMREALEGKGIRILLAEDDMTNQRVIRRYFQKVGVDLVIANDGNECLDTFVRLPKGHFSLILCDLFMPGRDGYAATRAIRDWEDEHLQEGEKRIPIVALSANVMANVAEKCLSSGFTSYLSKPVDFKRLSDTLRKLLL